MKKKSTFFGDDDYDNDDDDDDATYVEVSSDEEDEAGQCREDENHARSKQQRIAQSEVNLQTHKLTIEFITDDCMTDSLRVTLSVAVSLALDGKFSV